jgi:PPK2 family polyphosphate:nucleotide phosphotransferase
MEKRLRFVKELADRFLVKPGRRVALEHDFDPDDTAEINRSDIDTLLSQGIDLLTAYQDRLYAEDCNAVLLVLQGIDAAGKDSTIKHVMSGVHPQGVDVRSFKQPSVEELQHDFLWRYQRALPARGRIGIFNRSHYEEVLVVRVHPELLVAEHIRAAGEQESLWKRRYGEINEWEHYLLDNGVRVVKVFLNLSQREQGRRFLDRIDRQDKNWKFSPNDIRERCRWDEYQNAFNQMLSGTSTTSAPWHVIPADHKWFARLATAAVLAQTLADIDPKYPRVDPDVRKLMEEARVKLLAEIGDTK